MSAVTMRSFDSRYRRRRDARLTEAQVLAAHRLYTLKGWSLRTLGKMLYEPMGYASARSCANCLWEMFVAAGLPRRDRIEASVRASTTHGLRSRVQSDEQREAYNELRRRRRDRQPRCQGVRQWYPRKGQPCSHPSMIGSQFCFAHDPDTAELREAILVAARARLPCNGRSSGRPQPDLVINQAALDAAGVDEL